MHDDPEPTLTEGLAVTTPISTDGGGPGSVPSEVGPMTMPELEMVTVPLNSLRRLLAGDGRHGHSVTGIWNWDNGDAAGVLCTWCPLYEALIEAVGGASALRGFANLKP